MTCLRPASAALTEAQKKDLIRKQHGTASVAKKKNGSSKKGGSSGSSKKKKSPGGSHSESTKGKSHHGTSPGSHGKHDTASATVHPASPSSSSYQSPAANPTSPPPSPIAPTPLPAASSLPLPHGSDPSAPITIEKSGVEPDQGLEPVPAPEATREGFWSRVFGSHKSYRYLSSSVRSAIDHAPVKRGRWKYIVVHNSGTREGNARVFDIYHRRIRHMVNGLAYHFVIGDGHGSGDGQVEIGDRWKRQINGGHVASDYLNDIALGICLVGDFNRDQPTPAQVGALEELVSYLRERVGKSQGRRAIVHAHREINPRPTDCPGTRFPYNWLHAKFGNER